MIMNDEVKNSVDLMLENAPKRNGIPVIDINELNRLLVENGFEFIGEWKDFPTLKDAEAE